MPIQRVFLDWTRAGLEVATDFLVERSSSEEYVDLQHLIVVLPGGRAGRRLLELLQRRAESLSLPLIPPTITTVGALPELLFEPERPTASDFARGLAWLRALEETPAVDLHLLSPRPPERSDTLAWVDLADTLAGLHAELAGERLSFADVAARTADLPAFREGPRWCALARLQQRYLADLAAIDRDDPYAARLAALDARACRAPREIVLLGVAEVNAVLRAMLEQVADHVTALVLAPASLADRFDPMGCLRIDAWRDATLDVPDALLNVVDTPSDQAAAVLHAMADFGGRFAGDEIVVGVPDEEVVAPLEQQLALHGIASRNASGVAVSSSAPFRLLAAIADYLEHGLLTDLAALIRHPDLERHLRVGFGDDKDLRYGDWLTWLDACASRHLMTRAAPPWPEDEHHPGALQKLHDAVEAVVAGLRARPRPLREWSAPVLAILSTVYGQLPASGGAPSARATARCCLAIAQSVQEREDIDPRGDRVTTGFLALRLALRAVEGAAVPAPAGESAVEFLGWLELPLDDAPAAIITGLNEGRVPAATAVDPWLPEALRRHLGLLDQERRYARDAYALSVIGGCRQAVHFIAGRRSRASDPLAPSRLLLTGAPDAIARRVLSFYQGARTMPPLEGALRAGRRKESAVVVPGPDAPIARRSFGVSELGRYVKCPYSYYLEYVLKLRESDDHARELDAAAFGSLAHAVLAAFGRLDGGRSTDLDAVRNVLRALLDQEAARFGEHARPAVRVQVELLRARLDAFAAWQAGWAAQGWRITHVEATPPDGEEARFEVDGETITLSGRIDRIDHNARTGEWVILDYKVGNTARPPKETHQSKDAWIDFQLPMYRHLARALKVDGPLKVGFVSLSRDTETVDAHLAAWSDAELREADDAAREVVRSILQSVFWPPKPPSGGAFFRDRFEPILRATVPPRGTTPGEVVR